MNFLIPIKSDNIKKVCEGKYVMEASVHLAKFGITIADAKEFLLSNLSQPNAIFSTCIAHDVTTSMISEIVGVKNSEVIEFFVANGIDPSPLYPKPVLTSSNEKIEMQQNEILNSDLWADLGSRIDLIDLGNIEKQQVSIAGVIDSISIF